MAEHQGPEEVGNSGIAREPLSKTQLSPRPHGERDTALTPAHEKQSLESGLPGGRLNPQQSYGPYKILRLLGKGGMGEVYEALHEDSGRLLALKVLNHTIDSPEHRKRFLREGRLAASISHPNCVYVYGTEEIDGAQVIAMELAPGGSLSDRVKERGPLSIAKAVDAILQTIDGLEAAAAIGVLHRDIKPANCFVDGEGKIKIGDFGLSISTLQDGHTQLTQSGTILGTPAYASPEQLHGGELDVRSDIYSLAVTLYYLLTGKLPFQGDNMIKMLAAVLEGKPKPPTSLRGDIPKPLSRLILKCLAKKPAQRCQTYAELRKSLIHFSSGTPQPAPIVHRALAGAVDLAVVVPTLVIFSIWLMGYDLSIYFFPFNERTWENQTFVSHSIVGVAVPALYFVLLEGLWGASIGKALFRLRVVEVGGGAIGFKRILIRNAVFVPVWTIGTWLRPFFVGAGPSGLVVLGILNAVLDLVFLSTMRRRNGFATIYGLASRTRVVMKRTVTTDDVVKKEAQVFEQITEGPKIGPYFVRTELYEKDGCKLLLAFDPVLRRDVWIQAYAEATPPLSPMRRDLSRRGRLRWLNGNRSEGNYWDAYEAVDGKPFSRMLGENHGWKKTRQWLHGLSEELVAGQKTHSLPDALGLDRIWITSSGQAKVLDFAAPGTDGQALSTESSLAWDNNPGLVQEFLENFAAAALGLETSTSTEGQEQWLKLGLPMHGLNALRGLRDKIDEDPMQFVETLRTHIQHPTRITPRARIMHLGSFLLVPLIYSILAVAAAFAMFGELFRDDAPAALYLFSIEGRVEKLQDADEPLTDEESQELEALEVFIAGHFPEIENSRVFRIRTVTNPFSDSLDLASEITANRPTPSAQELEDAAPIVEPTLEKARQITRRIRIGLPTLGLLAITAAALGFELAVSPITALVFQGGLLLNLFGFAIVNGKAEQASRWRCFCRSLVIAAGGVAMLIGVIFCLRALSDFDGTMPEIILLGLSVPIFLTVITSIILSAMGKRSLHDRLAGTYVIAK